MAQVAGAAELTGGTLTALGFLWPLGPITSFGPMIVAWRKVHWDKPIWNTAGGAELPLLNLAIAGALTLAGPGAISLDRVLGVRMPWWLVALGMAGTGAGVAVALRREIGDAVEQARERRAAAIRDRQEMEEQELLDAAEKEPARMRSS
jgi:putative oxidoreductase